MTSRTTFVLMLVPVIVLPAVAAAASIHAAPAPQEAGWVTLMAEDFEGEFPHSPWHIGLTGAPYLWGQRTCNPHAGANSMWGGGGGSLGAQVACGSTYSTGYATTLSYGPIDLSGCSNLRVNFAHWTMLGPGDSLGVGFSNDGGASWQVLPIYGDAVSICGGWCEESFTMDRWTIPLCGRSRVYLLFRFASDAAGVSYGTFVDDVSLEAYYAGATPTATPTRPASVTPTATPTVTPTATQPSTVSHRVYLPLVRRP